MSDALRIGAAPEAARVLCVVLHGRAQSPEVMQDAVVRHLRTSAVCHHLPRAAEGTWYAARAIEPRSAQTEAELAAAIGQLAAQIADLRAAAPGLPLVLAGFSQGACLALEFVASGGGRPDAVVAFTGCRVGQVGDGLPNTPLGGLPVYLSGGDADPWIPVEAFAEAAGAFGRMGARLRADIFPGRLHEVSQTELAVLDGLLDDLAEGRAPLMETGP